MATRHRNSSRRSSPARVKRNEPQRTPRSLHLEPFEERTMFAVGPQLVAVIPSAGTVLADNQVLHTAPTELTLRFDSAINASTLVTGGVASIQVTRGGDHVLGNGNDVAVTAGFLGLGNASNDVVIRFSNTLPDDLYQVRIIGSGSAPLKGTNGQAFNGGADLTRKFTLDLGAQVVSIVPQPVSRDSSTNKLSQAVNEIDVYFNVNDPLEQTSATNPAFYQLIRTAGTATTQDDQLFSPSSVQYDNTTGLARLFFGTTANSPLNTAGTYRLRVGNNDPIALAPVNATVGSGAAGSSFATADNLGSIFTASQGTQSYNLSGAGAYIGGTPVTVVYPGAPNEPGTRDIPVENHLLGGAGTSGVIPTYYYNFQSLIGSVLGTPVFNVITEPQKQRVREVMAYYSHYLGVQFIESAGAGFTIATGDVRAVDPNVSPGGVGGIAGGGLAVMNSTVDWGSSESGGAYFETAMHEIGHLLGLGHTYELPPLTVQGSAETATGSPAAEPVFPGDADIVLGQYLHPPVGNDINVYKFSLASDGQLNLETFAQRLQTLNSSLDPSLLDTLISVFDSNGKLIARNDDYYGSDSFLQLQLSAGTYYVAVTSTGNSNFDPTIANSGAGGTSQGSYQLRLTFNPVQTTGIRDTSGTLIDGDADGTPGGVNNFWFKTGGSSQVIFVDKASTGGTGALGSITNPYTTISAALAAAIPGTIVRVEGNGGADKNLATVGDNLSYNIGFDSLGNPLSDGSKLEVPKDVTLMIDAGAIIKLRGANIDVGSSAQGIDRSGGALQVLGTPATNATGGDIGTVYITSYYNSAIGTDPNIAKGTLAAGNWGGLVFRDDPSLALPGDFDAEAAGIFLNYVNHANISYGGGQVVVNGILGVYDPIHLDTARPTVTFNRITNSADAAVSADPDSFKESEFEGANYDADYTRRGPEVHGNTLSNNSINGLFVRIVTPNQAGLDTMTVSGRFSTTDMVYVLQENLEIQGRVVLNSDPNAPDVQGNYYLDSNGKLQVRPIGRLAIDPGVIIKLGGARIETQVGSTLLAEGTAAKPIVFTSIFDDRYGAGGSFDVTNDGTATSPAEGNWGGLFFGPLSFGSVDHALITFAGGSTTVEGGTGTFNAVEIHQAKVRLANSTLEHNAAGGDSTDRSGRSSTTPAVIFVRGAQPIIVNNIIQNNDTTSAAGTTNTAAISINVNALNSQLISDWGMSTGSATDTVSTLYQNSGPLVRGNRLANNPINGMIVRGGTLTTDVVMDDTDIVHVLFDSVIANTQFSLSGTARLQSSSTESLVVKLFGASAGLVATGVPLDINDRSGGAIQVLGKPGHPVVMTSIYDTTVGAGLTPSGAAQTDTHNQATVTATSPSPGDWNGIQILPYSNDTNMDLINEVEQGFNAGSDVNNTPSTAQPLGTLAKDSKSGDDTQRLGFEVHGDITQTVSSSGGGDVDVYSFKGTAGTPVWFDIDRTSSALDSVVELVDANGAVIARSDNSLAEQSNPALLAGSAKPLQIGYAGSSGPFTSPDFFSTNPLNAGMRVDLPGTAGTVQTYYVRVRASNANLAANPVTAGLTKGEYVLQIRLQDTDQFPGSIIRQADIRYPTTGISVVGKPEHSPLTGETATTNTGSNNSFDTAQDLGNLLTSSENEISVSGSLSASNAVSWYKFDLNYDLIQQISNFSDGLKTFATMFSINYADGLGRPDTTLSVFDAAGNLLWIGRDSDTPDGQPTPTLGANTQNQSHGNYGSLDPTIGSVQVPAGGVVGPTGDGKRTYYVAVSSALTGPTILDATFQMTPTNPLVRLQPVNSVSRIVDDGIGSDRGTAADSSKQILPGTTPQQLDLNAVPYTLGDVVMFVNTIGNLISVNPFTGQVETFITGTTFLDANGQPQPGVDLPNFNNTDYYDMAMRNDGRLFMYQTGVGTNNTATTNGTFVQVDTGNNGASANSNAISTQAPNLPIQTNNLDPQNPINPPSLTQPATYNFQQVSNDPGLHIQGMAFGSGSPLTTGGRSLYVIGNRTATSGVNAPINETQNLLFGMDPDTGAPLTGTSESAISNGTYATYQPLATGLPQLAGSGTNYVPLGTLWTGRTIIASNATDPTAAFSSMTLQGGLAPSDLNQGDTITVGGAILTFETGPQLTINPTGNLAASTLANGTTFKINGVTFTMRNDGVGGVNVIPFTTNDSAATLGNAIATAVNAANLTSTRGTVEATFSSHRVTFLNAVANSNSPGSWDLSNFVGANFKVPNIDSTFLPPPPASGPLLMKIHANDTATTVASTIGAIITASGGVYDNGSGATIKASVSASYVTITGAAPTLTAPLQTDAPDAPAIRTGSLFSRQGSMTGLAMVSQGNGNDWMFAVSDDGAIYQVLAGFRSLGGITSTSPDFPSGVGFLPTDSFTTKLLNTFTDPSTGSRVWFTGVTAGPQNVEGGKYAKILFATDINGNIWAIDSTTGKAAGIFLDGATHVATGIFDLQGIAFSTLDYNLWHVTTARGSDPGHGVDVTPDYSTSHTDGGTSFYFGLEDPRRTSAAYQAAQPGAINYVPPSIRSPDRYIESNEGVLNSYNLPGGAKGSLVTDTFSLAGYNAADKPVLYFNYALDTQDDNAKDNSMNDSFRVFASSDGVHWSMLATNNSALSDKGTTDAELPSYISDSGGVYKNDKSNQRVQELFDAPGNPPTLTDQNPNDVGNPIPYPTTAVGWRQARVDLGDFAGQSNIRLRFDFSTAGSMGIGETRQGGVYLGVTDVSALRDGDTFTLSNSDASGSANTVFRLRTGYVLQAPAGGGPAFNGGETFTVNGITFQFTKTGSVAGGNVAVNISDSMSPTQVATAIANALTATPAAGVTPHQLNDRVQLVGATTATVSSPLTLSGSVAALASTDVPFTIDMTAAQVATQMATTIDSVFAALNNNIDDTSITTSTKQLQFQGQNSNVLVVYGRNVIGVSNASGLTFANSLPGDEHGVDASVVNPGTGFFDLAVAAQNAKERNNNNSHEGVYIDDIVVGFAGRGEMVTGNFDPTTQLPKNQTNPVTVTGVNTFTPLPVDPDASDPTRVSTGNFQLDIRRGAEYGASTSQVNADIALYRSFDVNDRLSQSFDITALPAWQLVDGQTFSILTELGTYVFEIDTRGNGISTPIGTNQAVTAIVISPSDDATTVASKIANAINTVPASKNFNVKAGLDKNGIRVSLYNAVDVRSGPFALTTFDDIGDPTPLRVQGQTIIESNFISHALQSGVAVLPEKGTDSNGIPNGDALVAGHTNSVENLPTLNSQQLVPGITIRNNVISGSGTAGIVFSGTPSSDIASAVPFGRIVNNTVVGSPVGIGVGNNASPTILNNIIAQTTQGIFVDASSIARGTVVGTSLYQSNTQNLVAPGIIESNAIVLQPTDPLFVDSANGNYYLKSGSAAIDSSLNSLSDRPAMIAVDTPLGIPASPIQAPDYDALGQLRFDDPTVPNPPGLGANPYKDRGAIERADFSGPVASLVNPVDNDPAGVDRSSLATKVIVVGQTMSVFSIQLNDSGVGVDNSTISAGKITVKRTVGSTTTTLSSGADYTIGFDTTNRIITLTALSGVWSQATYTITLDNSALTGIKDIAGNVLQGNQASGITQFTIQLSDTAPSRWQNPNNKLDVNNDGIISGSDAIIIINRLIKPTYATDFPGGVIPAGTPAPPYIDVDGDGKLFPIDVIQVINYLNSHPPGTSSLVATASAAPTVTTDSTPAAASAVVAEPAASGDATSDDTSVNAPAVDQSAIVVGLTATAAPNMLAAGPFGIVDVQSSAADQIATGSAVVSASDDAFASSDDLWDSATSDLDEVLSDLTDRETESNEIAYA